MYTKLGAVHVRNVVIVWSFSLYVYFLPFSIKIVSQRKLTDLMGKAFSLNKLYLPFHDVVGKYHQVKTATSEY